MNVTIPPIDISAIYHFLNSLKKLLPTRQFHLNDITDLLKAEKKALADPGILFPSN
jgi:hypothetical protein